MGTSPSGFFAALYDFSFHSFVTPKIVRIVYVIALAIIALWALSFLISGFIVSRSFLGEYQPSAGTMLFHLVGAAVIFVVGSIAARINLEFIIAVFRIAENTEALRGVPVASQSPIVP
jgi:hypothetical protein